MSLFSFDPQVNILPHDGVVHYHDQIMNSALAESYFLKLMKSIAWKNDEAMIFGKHIITKRKVAWYADEAFDYTYSKITKSALVWTEELIELRSMAQAITGVKYNSCLLNLYHDGSEGMAYHSDDEKALGKDSSIASMSFGAERKFLFKHKKTKETVGLFLAPGSLLEMKGQTQTNWLHRLPPTKMVKTPRVNLTFRTMVKVN